MHSGESSVGATPQKAKKATKERADRQPGTLWWLGNHCKMLQRELGRAETLFAEAQEEYRKAESACMRFPSLDNTAEISLAKKKLDDAKGNLEYQDDKWDFLNKRGVAIRDEDPPHTLGAQELEWNEVFNTSSAAASAGELHQPADDVPQTSPPPGTQRTATTSPKLQPAGSKSLPQINGAVFDRL